MVTGSFKFNKTTPTLLIYPWSKLDADLKIPITQRRVLQHTFLSSSRYVRHLMYSYVVLYSSYLTSQVINSPTYKRTWHAIYFLLGLPINRHTHLEEVEDISSSSTEALCPLHNSTRRILFFAIPLKTIYYIYLNGGTYWFVLYRYYYSTIRQCTKNNYNIYHWRIIKKKRWNSHKH